MIIVVEITHHWTLIDRLIQQVVLQQDAKDPDHVLLSINVDKVVKE